MSDRRRQATGAADRGDGHAGMDAGMDARGRATQEQLPIARGRAMHGAIAEDGARAAKVRRNAWLLAGLALVFYVGYMAWMLLRSSSGG
jgi:hypothetical protein